MSRRYSKSICVVLAATVIAAVTATAPAMADVMVQNAGFETPALPTGTTIFTSPMGSLAPDGVPGWTFGETSAATGVYDGIDTGSGQRRDKTSPQAAYMEINGWCSQSISGWDVGNYTVSFYSESVYGSQPLRVLIDDNVLTFGGEQAISPPTNMKQLFTSDPFAVAPGSHTLKFTGTGTGMVFIDDVSVGTVPEPSAALLLCIGVTGVLTYAWRKRR